MFDLGKAIFDAINTVANEVQKQQNLQKQRQAQEAEEELPKHMAPESSSAKKTASPQPAVSKVDSSDFNTGVKYTPSLDFNRVWRFNRTLLSKQDQSLYDAIQAATTNCIPSVRIRCSSTPHPNHLMQVTLALIEDDPSLFYIDSGITVRTQGDLAEIQFKYNRYLDQKDKYYEQMKNVAKKVYESRVRRCSTVYEAELAIHDYLTENVTYDNSDEVGAHSPVGPLLTNKGVCEGISEAFCFIACACGIKTSMISGMLNKERHRWNLVEIGGKKYHLDVTSDLSGMHAFFNCSDNKIRQTHSFEKKSNCRSMDMNYYSVNGANFSSLNDAAGFLRDNAANAPKTFEFMLDSAADPQMIGKAIQSGLRRNASIKITSSNNGCYRVIIK